MEQQRLRDGEIRRSVKGVRKSKHVIPGDRRKSGVGWEPGEVEVTAQDGSPEEASKTGCGLKH